MEIFCGYDEKGNVIKKECKRHKYSDLPMKGLERDLSGVNMYEPITIKDSDLVVRECILLAERVKERAVELDAEVVYIKEPGKLSQESVVTVYFKKK